MEAIVNVCPGEQNRKTNGGWGCVLQAENITQGTALDASPVDPTGPNRSKLLFSEEPCNRAETWKPPCLCLCGPPAVSSRQYQPSARAHDGRIGSRKPTEWGGAENIPRCAMPQAGNCGMRPGTREHGRSSQRTPLTGFPNVGIFGRSCGRNGGDASHLLPLDLLLV